MSRTRRVVPVLILAFGSVGGSSWAASRALQGGDAASGRAVYEQRCASCHETGGERIPRRDALEQMPPSRILRALDFGSMMTVAFPLSRAERQAVAELLGKGGPEPQPSAEAFCKDRRITLSNRSGSTWNGWSPDARNARYQPESAGGLTANQLGQLTLKWAFGFAGDISAFASPTIVDGHVFVGSAGGMVQALGAENGCLKWMYQAAGAVRSAPVIAPLGRRHALLFGDMSGWFYALEAESGRLLWKKRIDDHEGARVVGAAQVHDGVAYVGAASWEETRAMNPGYACCTFRGSVSALRVRDGTTLWKTYTIPEEPTPRGSNKAGTPRLGPSGAGVWSAPTLDLKRRLLYVTTGDNYSTPATRTSDAVMAINLSGRIVWTRQTVPGDAYNSACGIKGINCPDTPGPDFDFGSSAILVTTSAGRDLLVAGQKSGIVYAFDPDRSGEIVWQSRVGQGGVIGGVQWGMAADRQAVYAPASDAIFTTGAAVRTLSSTSGGGLTALRVDDGTKVWYAPPISCGGAANCSPAQSAAVTAVPGAVFSAAMDGHLRAYSSADGTILWDFDTKQSYTTVNGIPGKGGAIDGAGPVVAGGMLFVNSGYSRFGGAAGNVLLAFAPR